MVNGHSISETVALVALIVLLPEAFLLWKFIVDHRITSGTKNWFFKISCVSYSYAISGIMMTICDFLRGNMAISSEKDTVLIVVAFLLKSIAVILMIIGGLIFLLIEYVPNKESPGFWKNLNIDRRFRETWYNSIKNK